MQNPIQFTQVKQRIGLLIAIVVVIILIFLTIGFVRAGERGVHMRLGAVTGIIYNEGMYFKIPLVDTVKRMDVKIQKQETDADAASKDLQTVHAVVALNYHVDPDQTARLYQEVGKSYKIRIIDPALQEAIKAGMAMYTAEELITRRPEVRESVKDILRDRLSPRGIILDEFNIVNFNFSQQFNRAIEEKVTAEQDALTAQNQLERVKFEAQQRIEVATAEAEAIRIQAQSISQQGGDNYVNLKAIEKWNGVLPRLMTDGGSVPFINIEE